MGEGQGRWGREQGEGAGVRQGEVGGGGRGRWGEGGRGRWAAATTLLPLLSGGRVGSDLFWTKTLVYTELLTPGWYSSGGMTPGHRRARWYFLEGLRDLPCPSSHCGAGGHTCPPAPPLVTVHAPHPLPVTHTPATATLSPFRWYFSSSGFHSTRLHQNSATALTTSQPPASRKSSKS